MHAISPCQGVTLAVTTTTGSIALGSESENVAVYNQGTNKVFVKLGTSAVTAAVPTGTASAAAGFPVASGQTIVFSRGAATHIAGIAAATESGTIWAFGVNGKL